jgi:ferredoxin
MKAVGTLIWLPENETQPAYEEISLLVHAMWSERRHPQKCGGQAECGTCRIRVVAGAENLTVPTIDEAELTAEHPEAFAADERLACQCRPTGDVTIELPARRIPDLRFSG